MQRIHARIDAIGLTHITAPWLGRSAEPTSGCWNPVSVGITAAVRDRSMSERSLEYAKVDKELRWLEKLSWMARKSASKVMGKQQSTGQAEHMGDIGGRGEV